MMPALPGLRISFASGLLLLILAPGASAFQGAAAPSASSQEQAAIKLQQAGDWKGAVAAFEALARAEPSNPRAAFGLGVALHETGRPAEAIPVLVRARSLGYQPVNQVRFRLARAYAKAGEPGKAMFQMPAF